MLAVLENCVSFLKYRDTLKHYNKTKKKIINKNIYRVIKTFYIKRQIIIYKVVSLVYTNIHICARYNKKSILGKIYKCTS